jgi:hypothetical protein
LVLTGKLKGSGHAQTSRRVLFPALRVSSRHGATLCETLRVVARDVLLWSALDSPLGSRGGLLSDAMEG